MASITPVPHVRLLACDWANTVTGRTTAEGTTTFAHTPFGHRSPETDEDDGAGFNGQHQERHGGYLLGHGYRAYRPTLGRFNAPDSYSPFGSGGLNCYAYCRGEPVNRQDPSGHREHGTKDGDLFSWFNIGIGLLMASAGIGLLGAGRAKNLGLGLAVGGALQAGMGTAALQPNNKGTKDAMNIGALGFLALGAAGGVAGRMLNRTSKRLPTNLQDGGLVLNTHAVQIPRLPGTEPFLGSSPLTSRASSMSAGLYYDAPITPRGSIAREAPPPLPPTPPALPLPSDASKKMVVQSAKGWAGRKAKTQLPSTNEPLSIFDLIRTPEAQAALARRQDALRKMGLA